MRMLLIALSLTASLAAVPAVQAADSGFEPSRPAGWETRMAQTSLDEAVAKVRNRFGGRVLKAETRYRDGRPIHHIRLLTDDGRVRTVRVDGVTGRILG